MKKVLVPLSYEEMFFQRCGPVGHYIFTDHDRLSRFELDCMALFCQRLADAAPDALQLNQPTKVKDRYALLFALHQAGINSFTATRVDTGQKPPRYPAFIRAEDGSRGPETDLIENDAAFDQAIVDLAAEGKTKRGRIAVGFAAQAGEDGFYRKYGAYRVGGDILPHHIQVGRNWVVKRTMPDLDWSEDTDYADALKASVVAEELAYVRDNPHRDILGKVFDIAGIDFGRVDYGIVDGRVEIYEINTNPTLPRFGRSDARNATRQITKPQLMDGFHALNTSITCKKRVVPFRVPRPKHHSFRLPVRNLHRAVFRRLLRL